MTASIAVGIPHIGAFSGKFLDSIVGLEAPEGGYHLIRVTDLPVDMARNELVKRFLESPELQYLLMLDRDMVFHPQSLLRLLYRLHPEVRLGVPFGEQIDMVGALAFTRSMPPVPTVFRGVAKVGEGGHEYLRIQVEETYDWLAKYPAARECPAVLPGIPPDSLVRADATGCAFVLIPRYVFEAVPYPWFERDGLKRGEDLDFFQKTRHAGFRLCVDRSVTVGHEWGDAFIGPRDFVAYQSISSVEGAVT